MRFVLFLWGGALLAQTAVPLETLDLAKVAALASPMGYPARAGRSVADQPLTLRGKIYEHGVGLHSGSRMLIDLHGQAQQFTALAGVDEAKLAIPAPLPGISLVILPVATSQSRAPPSRHPVARVAPLRLKARQSVPWGW